MSTKKQLQEEIHALEADCRKLKIRLDDETTHGREVSCALEFAAKERMRFMKKIEELKDENERLQNELRIERAYCSDLRTKWRNVRGRLHQIAGEM